jgi:hypothetical protein
VRAPSPANPTGGSFHANGAAASAAATGLLLLAVGGTPALADGAPNTVPGASVVSTIALGINNIGCASGRYYDTSGGVQAFLYNLYSEKLLTYDYPGATQTSFNGINNLGYISGRYTDSHGVNHGFIARLVDDDGPQVAVTR